MKDIVRWPLVIVFILILAGLFHMAKALDIKEVVRVYDGDTIELDDGSKVRLIGVDAPEVDSPYGKAEPNGEGSKLYLEKLVLGQKVRVRRGPQAHDQYGRILAYIYLNDILVNGRIIRDGWARAFIRYRHRFSDLFVSYEKEARARNIGMWRKN